MPAGAHHSLEYEASSGMTEEVAAGIAAGQVRKLLLSGFLLKL
jgi:hypothetical protein